MADQQIIAEEQSDEALMVGFQSGKMDAFNILVGRYKNQLTNFAFRYVGDYDQANDIVQEVFIRLYRSGHSYRPIAKFSTWLYTIAANLSKSELRRRKRRAIFSLSHLGTGSQQKDFEIPDERYAADSETVSSLKRDLIQKALDSIASKYREVVILCDIQELSYEEICEVTGLNIGTVKSRLNRGRSMLQILLKDIIE